MILKCVGRYRTQNAEYAPGDDLHVSDEMGEFLLRDAPTSFVRVDEVPASAATGDAATAAVAADPDLTAMSTETQTGLVVPDRRARGGRKRSQ